jgi:ribosomal protein S18 acetylase RimI-like enzyme
MIIRHGRSEDFPWLLSHDDGVGRQWIKQSIESGEYLVAEQNVELIGFLRFSRFWGKIPYMEMIRVLPEHRRSSAGTALFHEWENAMIGEGARLLMTSSELGEIEPQAWHKRNGFCEAGKIDFLSIQPTPEVFFLKTIA